MATPTDPVNLSRLLMYGSAQTRRSLADGLRAAADDEGWAILARTARGPGPWLLRARCLEVLGLAAGAADRWAAEAILSALFADDEEE